MDWLTPPAAKDCRCTLGSRREKKILSFSISSRSLAVKVIGGTKRGMTCYPYLSLPSSLSAMSNVANAIASRPPWAPRGRPKTSITNINGFYLSSSQYKLKKSRSQTNSKFPNGRITASLFS